MQLHTAWLDVFARAFDFHGRSGRIEVWSFQIFLWLLNVPLIWLATIYQLSDGYFYGLWLALAIPALALSVRRLHDMDLVGWWVLVASIPYLNWGFLAVLLLVNGSEQSNRFGVKIDSKSEKKASCDQQVIWSIQEIRKLPAFDKEKVKQAFERAYQGKDYDTMRSVLVEAGLSPSEAYEFVAEQRKT